MSNPVRFMLVLALLGATVLSSPAKADIKSFGGGSCFPRTPTTLDTITLRSTGITNETEVSQYVNCVIPKDAEAAWTGGFLQVGFVSGRDNSNFQCTLYSGTLYEGYVTSVQNTVANNGQKPVFNWNLPDVVGPSYYSPPSIFCKIPPRGTLAVIFLAESDPTDTPIAP